MEGLHPRTLSRLSAAALAMILFSGCRGERPTNRTPNTQAPAVTADLEGHDTGFDLAYGVGLAAGCNPDEFLNSHHEIKQGTTAQEAYSKILQRFPSDETVQGLYAGLQRGLSARQDPHSAVC